MNNMQLWIALGIPSFLVLVGILLNLNSSSRLEARLTVIEGDLRRFYELLGEHSGKIELLTRK